MILLELMQLNELKNLNELEDLKAYIKLKATENGFADAVFSNHWGNDRLLGTQEGASLQVTKNAVDDLFNRKKPVVKQWIADALEKHHIPGAPDYGIRYTNKRRKCGFAFAIRFAPNPTTKELEPTLRCVTFYNGVGFKGNGDNDTVLSI